VTAADADFLVRAKAIRDNPKKRDAAWRAGQLWWLLDPLQYSFYLQFWGADGDVVWNLARRLGKTFLLLVLVCEICLRGRNRSAKYAAPTAKAVRKMIRPSFRKIIATAPKDVRPVPRNSGDEWEFPSTDSVLDIAGCDNQNYELLRGQENHIWVADEGGYIDELEYVVNEVLKPQTWTTKGRGIISSTPPKSPGHPFRQRYLAAKARGRAAHATFWQNARLSEAEKHAIVKEAAEAKGLTVEQYVLTPGWQREGMAEFVLDTSVAVLPLLTEAAAARLLVPEVSTPLWSDWYTIIDLGGSRDPTGVLVGYWDYNRRKTRWQAGELLWRPSTRMVAEAVQRLEWETFGLSPQSADAPFKPPGGPRAFPRLRGEHIRIMDDDMGFVRRDLATKYGLTTSPPHKDDKEAGLMDLQDALMREEIEVDPAAHAVLDSAQAAIWNKQHTEYDRTPDLHEIFGHFDLLDCGLYMHRNVAKNKGRVPAGYGIDRQNTVWREYPRPVEDMTQRLRSFIGGRRG
jgi:hypothetical protein